MPAWIQRCVFFLLALPLTCTAGQAGTELRFTALDLPGQAEPSVVADPQGGFILTSIERAGSVATLSYHRIDRSGERVSSGEIASGSDWFVNWADFPSLVVADNGDWVSFYLRKSDPAAPYAYDIWTLRSQDQGASWSQPQRLHDDGTTTEHGFVSLLADGDDRVLAVWLDGRRGAAASDDEHGHGGAHTSLRSAVLTRQGPPVEQVELDDLTCDCCSTDAVRGADGPLVVYRNRSEQEIRDIGWLQRAAGSWSSPVIGVADHWKMPGCPVNGPALSKLGDAQLLAWPTLRDEAFELRLARNDRGTWKALASLERHPELLGRVDATPWGERQALVSWLGASEASNPSAAVLRLARLDESGKLLAQYELQQLPPGRSTGMPKLASHGERALLVWTEPDENGSRVRGILIEPPLPTAGAGE